MPQPTGPDIWITGAAAITALGETLATTWEAMLAGRTAGRHISLQTPNGGSIRVPAAPVDSDLLANVPLESSLCRADRMALYVAQRAAVDAGLDRVQLAGAAVVFGSSKPAITSWPCEAASGCGRGVEASHIIGCFEDRLSSSALDILTYQREAVRIASALAAQGAILSSVSACSTGLHSLIRGVQWLQDGCGSIAVVGSVESSLNPLYAAGFARMRVLAMDWPEPSSACRPFDQERSGFIMGEGAAALILETADHARRRGAMPLVAISGYARGADPTGLAELDATGRPLASTIRRCLARAGADPEHIACVKAHGTGTRLNDAAEDAAIAHALARPAVPVVSLKGYLGHTLGASGAIETAVCVEALRRGWIPGNANLAKPDPACTGHHPRAPLPAAEGQSRQILCLSAGFGGHLAAVLLRPGE